MSKHFTPVQPTTTCVICKHPERARIEDLRGRRVSSTGIRREFPEVTKSGLCRHWGKHVSPQRKALLALGPGRLHAKLQAFAESVVDVNMSHIDHYRLARSGIYTLLDAALEGGDRVGYAMLVGRLHENLAATARLTGQLASSPLVQNTTNVFLLPQFAEVQAVLVRVLAAHPAARADVIRAFREMEARVATPAEPANSRALIEQGSHAAA